LSIVLQSRRDATCSVNGKAVSLQLKRLECAFLRKRRGKLLRTAVADVGIARQHQSDERCVANQGSRQGGDPTFQRTPKQ
jgi:hypothetical protein